MDGIVALEVTPQGVEIFLRAPDGGCRREEQKFSPWCLAEKNAATQYGSRRVALAGDGALNCRVEFDSPADYEKALTGLKKEPGVMLIRDTGCQFLCITGSRFFSGMDFSGLRRMELAVVPGADGSEVQAVEVAGNDGFFTRIERSGECSELDLLTRLNDIILRYDPDLLEGIGLFSNALVLLEKRAKKLKFNFSCGRNGSGFTSRKSRFSVAEKQISCNRYFLYGRQLADISHLLLFYDAVHRDFESFELDYLREYFHIAAKEESLIARALSDLLSPAVFYKCCTLPLSYQDCVIRGSGAALDMLFTAEYQRAGYALPYPEPVRRFAGALTGAGTPGVYHNVRHCDVRSLYPSILLHLDRRPVRDELNVFIRLLRELRQFRLEAKDRARELPPGKDKQRFEALQSTFKILINSFYGYLGFAQGSFNDYTLAETMTAFGRELLSNLADKLDSLGASILEMDTDGIYFTMPDEVPPDFDAALRLVLPEGIELDFDAEYPAMYCYKAKNYALLNPDGAISVSGAALKSRALEKFQREFISAVLRAKLLDSPEIMEECYQELRGAIENRTIPVAMLAKSEVLSDSPENYKRKQGAAGFRRSAPYELALASGRKFRAGDKVEFYVTGTKAKLPVVGNSRLLADADPANRDENTAFYLAKLDELYQQFK